MKVGPLTFAVVGGIVLSSQVFSLCDRFHVTRVFGFPSESLVHVTLDVWTIIWSMKHRLITKLIAQFETNLRDESIKPN